MLLNGSCSVAQPSAFETFGIGAVSYHVSFHDDGWLNPLPGTMIAFAAPVARIASMAACAALNHCIVEMAFGSFISAKMMLALSWYRVASRLQRSANALLGTAAEPTA